MRRYEKIKVTNISLNVYVNEDGESLLSDEGFQAEEGYSQQNKEDILNCLTRRQKEVADLLFAGYERQQIADNLGICVQAIHQIILRIRKRLAKKAGVSTKGWKRKNGAMHL